ncbi:MAG: hypothetical protein J0H99_04925, partial [Rhodospirillales bacterium]|nr:hypothetical protein [Rhodospirillales bacterium]
SIIVAPLLAQNADLSGQTINWGVVSSSVTTGENNAIAALKQVMSQYSTDASRVYVTGNSMGGIGTWDMLIKYNAYTGTDGKIFAAGMPLAGADYDNGYPTPPDSVIQALKNVPIWAIHGSGDTSVPLGWDRNVYAAEQKIGGIMKYTEDPSLGHDVWDTYYTQAGPWNWLYSQKLSTGTTPTPAPTQAPTQTPAPTATPKPVASPDNTVVKAGSTTAITDASGNKWTITSGGQVAVNGVVDATTARVTVLAYEKGLVWQENADNLWWSKSKPTYAWGPAAGTSTSPIPPTSTPAPTPAPTSAPTGAIVVGSGSDSIVLMMSEDADGPAGAAGRDAQFTVNVDGKQIGGLQTVTASHAAGQKQAFEFRGNYGVGTHTVTVTFANNSMTQGDKAAFNDGGDRNLYVDSVTYDGTAVKTTTTPIYTSPLFPPNGPLDPGNAVFTVTDKTAVPAGAPSTPTTTPATVNVGSGTDTLVLKMSEDPYQGDAQFTVKVDGKQVGGTLTTTAVSWQGQTQEFDLHGNWGTGAHQVTVTYLNDASGQKDAAGNTYDAQDRNLYVNAMSYDGKAVSGTPWELFSNGSKTFTVPATTTTTSTSAAQAQPTITQTLASGQVSTVDASKAGTTQANGDTFSLTASGVGKAVLGAATETLRFAGMSNLSLTGGTGKATVIADRGTHTFTAGKGALDVTGGTGADTYVVNAGAGALTVQDFSRAQGDVLSIDRRLQAGAVIGSDGHGGTAISFHAASPVTGTIDLKNVAALPTDSIWV